jgi:hypothetical protein
MSPRSLNTIYSHISFELIRWAPAVFGRWLVRLRGSKMIENLLKSIDGALSVMRCHNEAMSE